MFVKSIGIKCWSYNVSGTFKTTEITLMEMLANVLRAYWCFYIAYDICEVIKTKCFLIFRYFLHDANTGLC